METKTKLNERATEIPADEKGFYRNADFGWHDVLVPLDEFLKGRSNVTINENFVTMIENDYYDKF